MATSPYKNLESILSVIKQRGNEGDWEGAAQIAVQLGNQISAQGLQNASIQDKAAIEAALEHISGITEYAEPLRNDIARLLEAFTPTESQP